MKSQASYARNLGVVGYGRTSEDFIFLCLNASGGLCSTAACRLESGGRQVRDLLDATGDRVLSGWVLPEC